MKQLQDEKWRLEAAAGAAAAAAAASVPYPEPEAEKDHIAPIIACVDNTGRNIGVRARAGSGKTHCIAVTAKHVRDRNMRLLALTLNCDARRELEERDMPEARTFHSLGAKAWYKAHRKSTLAATAEEQEEAAEEAAADADDCAADEARAYTPRALCRTAPVQNAYVPNKSKMLLRLMYPKPAEDTSRSSLSLEVHLFESFVVKMVSLAKMEAGIELVLKKRLSKTRTAQANARWPTAVSRLEAGLSMARKCFGASIHCALNSAWEALPGEVVCELGSGKKAKPLPVLDFDDLLHMPVRQGLSLDPGPPRRLGHLRRLDGPLRWVLADETQDNSRIRQLMLQRLALYGWAFAMEDALETLFETFDCKVYSLPICRRCPESHIKLANTVIDNATNGAGEDRRRGIDQMESLDEVESALHSHVAAEEGRGVEYALSDLAECIRLLIGRVREDSSHEAARLKALREAVRPPVELATVHKAKGLGWPVVYLLEPSEIPFEFALEQGGWQARQELNVQYVAYTRAEQTLIFLRDATPQPKPEGFSLRDALATTLWPEGQGGAGGQGAAAAGAANHAHPRDRYEWSAEGAFHEYRSSHQQRAANDAEEHAEEALATARDVLGLPPPPTALSEAQVDRAYKDQARKLHPDRCDAADATKRMQEVVAARDVLKDYLQREFAPDEVV
ncbi:hypothetical protein EMIHUDRAFT_102833 [Emiliania huxleyi CCMP1516]|uniref:DNA 3'-5' helicase n=2 Tax=Emiliania huxleyi TaxID=2903 RepID=A0A0D3J057_EMIH1|nr:hypothetical protein EMIHUDRAFT_102833 [Emiliania huxleyi CCMP1516]EOD16892.1 hypothetical protein EMIHUDRAFT_102833 [Emiliania huxleyi CCMP1516]|eukprot:XP_005769321.1 hypothetical protein EMIHUDRAFT_102833 [Emiliania huxleyi CCMP1516]